MTDSVGKGFADFWSAMKTFKSLRTLRHWCTDIVKHFDSVGRKIFDWFETPVFAATNFPTRLVLHCIYCGGTLFEKCECCRTWSAPLVTCSSPASRARSVSPSPSPSFSGNPARWRPCLRRLAFTTTPAVVGWVGEEDYQPPLWSTISTITSPHPPTNWAYSFDIAYTGKEQLTLLHNIFQRHIGFPQKSDEITS